VYHDVRIASCHQAPTCPMQDKFPQRGRLINSSERLLSLRGNLEVEDAITSYGM